MDNASAWLLVEKKQEFWRVHFCPLLWGLRVTREVLYTKCDRHMLMQSGTKGPFIATQLNSTRRRVELSCVAINGPLQHACTYRLSCTWK